MMEKIQFNKPKPENLLKEKDAMIARSKKYEKYIKDSQRVSNKSLGKTLLNIN